MKTFIKANGSLLPDLPPMFDEFFGKDLFTWTNPQFQPESALPSVNIKESNTSFELEVAAPGLEKKDFKVVLENNVLTISSNKENKVEEKDSEGKYTRKEFNYASFSRSFTLPSEIVQGDRISATYNDGILKISVPKKEEASLKACREIKIA